MTLNNIPHQRPILFGIGLVAVIVLIWQILPSDVDEPTPAEPIAAVAEVSDPAPFIRHDTIGTSTEGRPISVTRFGNGDRHVLLVGGVHGGYEWNSIVLAEAMIEHFTETPALIPENLTVSIIPVLNPDGLAVVTGGATQNITPAMVSNWSSDGRGRFNANNVDLNRNFDCKWEATAQWRGQVTSAGTSPFSEPEAAALRDYVADTNPVAAVFWHSVAGAVYASECEDGILPGTRVLMNAYAAAARYGAVPVFDAYPITGDVEGWLASIGIPAVTVELATRDSIEWAQNLAGTEAILSAIAAGSI